MTKDLLRALKRALPAVKYYHEHEGAPDLLKTVRAMIKAGELAERLKATRKPVRVLLAIEGGNLQSYDSDGPVELHIYDWDNIKAGDNTEDDLTPISLNGIEPEELTAMIEKAREEALSEQVDAE